jgi:LmbE family N-acetylglucosaminyl deacetylase
MSWSISVIENTAQVPLDKRAEVAMSIVVRADTFSDYDTGEIADAIDGVFGGTGPGDTYLTFNSDDAEHMDYITTSDAICAAMAAAGVEGRICFGSLEGDDAGDFWGVEFKAGHYRSLTGKLVWEHGTSHPG